mgnify:CR=1 FL=1
MTPKSNSNQNLQELYEKGDFESIKNWANSDELPPPSPREGSIKSQASKDSKNTIIKLHNFQSLIYKTPTWCKHCNNFIWGFQKNGWKCQGFLFFLFFFILIQEILLLFLLKKK